MSGTMTREELVKLTEQIINFDFTQRSEDEHSKLIAKLEANVPHPSVRDLLYWDERGLSPSQIIEEALNYKPIAL